MAGILGNDHWEKVGPTWVRHHVVPRRQQYHPATAAATGPEILTLEEKRTTHNVFSYGRDYKH